MDTKKINIVDYIYWFALILYSNPGGVLFIYQSNENRSNFIFDILFIILFLCYLRIWNFKTLQKDKYLKNIIRYFLIFLVYYIVVFSVLVPLFKDNSFYSSVTAFQKLRYVIAKFFLLISVYQFTLRSYKLFYKFFLITSIFAIVVFLFGVVTGYEILPIRNLDRRFTVTKRLLMHSYGFMLFLIPMGIVLLVYQFKTRFKKIILIEALLVYLLMVLAILRRYVFGAIVLIFVASVCHNYIYKKNLLPFKKIFKFLLYFSIVLLVIQLSFPKYIEAGITSAEETIHIVQYGESLSGKKDVRMGLGKDFMKELIADNMLFGTGFDNRWRTGEGDKQGFEAADYPMLSALGMTGLVGLFLFLPIYIVLIKVLIFDLKYLRKNEINLYSFESYILISFIIYFTYDTLQYMNWFHPVSLISHLTQISWYVFLAMYFAMRKIFYTQGNPNESMLKV